PAGASDDGDVGVDGGAGAGGAGNLDVTANLPGALVHRLQSQVTGEIVVRVEPLTVIADVQLDSGGGTGQVNLDRLRLRVLDGVMHRFLGDPVEHFLHVQADLRLDARLEADLDPVPGAEGRRLLGQRG